MSDSNKIKDSEQAPHYGLLPNDNTFLLSSFNDLLKVKLLQPVFDKPSAYVSPQKDFTVCKAKKDKKCLEKTENIAIWELKRWDKKKNSYVKVLEGTMPFVLRELQIRLLSQGQASRSDTLLRIAYLAVKNNPTPMSKRFLKTVKNYIENT